MKNLMRPKNTSLRRKKMLFLTRSTLNLKEFKRKTPPVCIHVHSDAAEYA
jgi:hypothetical protein